LSWKQPRIPDLGDARATPDLDSGSGRLLVVGIEHAFRESPSNTFIYPSVDAVGDLYVAFASFPINRNREPLTLYVARSTDDGVSFSPFVAAVKGVGMLPTDDLSQHDLP